MSLSIFELSSLIIANNAYQVTQNMMSENLYSRLEGELTVERFWEIIDATEVRSKASADILLTRLLLVNINNNEPFAQELFEISRNGNLRPTIETALRQEGQAEDAEIEQYVQQLADLKSFEWVILILAILGLMTLLKLFSRIYKII